jgi:hypothetical protein
MKVFHFPVHFLKPVLKKRTSLDNNIIQATIYSGEVLKTSDEMKTLKKEFGMIIKLST